MASESGESGQEEDGDDATLKDEENENINEHRDQGEEDEVDDGDDEDEEEEPRLEYASMTRKLAPVYRNGDATSSFLVAGDKMVSYSPEIHCGKTPENAPNDWLKFL